MKELRFFFYFVYKVQRDTWVLEDWQIISLFCVCDLTVYYNAAWIPMNNSACVYNQNRYSFQRAAQSLLWLCEAFSFVCRTGNIFNSSGSGCRFCSELWWVRFQKIPGLRIDCFIFWDASQFSFTPLQTEDALIMLPPTSSRAVGWVNQLYTTALLLQRWCPSTNTLPPCLDHSYFSLFEIFRSHSYPWLL